MGKKAKRDEKREERIRDDILVECESREDEIMAWCYYLEEKFRFPFTATCILKRAISPLRVKDEVEVIAMAPEDECKAEVFVMMPWEKDGLAVPLAQLKPISHTDEQTQEAVADWHYWVDMGYEY